MAVVFQPDPAVALYNSFVSVQEADDYFAKRLFAPTWTSALQATKESALMWATNQLNTLKWKGVRTSGTQLLSFPRKGLTYTESSNTYGGNGYESYDIVGMGYFTIIPVPTATVPTEIKQATAELAFWLMSSDTTAPTGLVGFKRIKVDSIELEMFKNEAPPWFDKAVRNLCKIFLLDSSEYSVSTRRVG